MEKKEIEVFYPIDNSQWRAWLSDNHELQESVWLVMHNKATGKASVTWSDAVDQALCFGWIDSKKISVGEGQTHQFFSKRKAKSTWSKINKDKIEKLTEAGLMKKAGLASIELAKSNGSWSFLDQIDALIVPADLENAFEKYPGSKEYFTKLSNSIKKMMLYWIVVAKRPETRQSRIEEIVSLGAKGEKPKQF